LVALTLVDSSHQSAIKRTEQALRAAYAQGVEDSAKVAEDMGHSNGRIRGSHKHLAKAIRNLDIALVDSSHQSAIKRTEHALRAAYAQGVEDSAKVADTYDLGDEGEIAADIRALIKPELKDKNNGRPQGEEEHIESYQETEKLLQQVSLDRR
jgi:precorrin-6x reductase